MPNCMKNDLQAIPKLLTRVAECQNQVPLIFFRTIRTLNFLKNITYQLIKIYINIRNEAKSY